MKKVMNIKNILLVSLCGFSLSVLAAPKDELNKRLNQHDVFSATFTQKVISPEKEVLMEGKGKMDIARPNMLRWETTSSPNENLLVSDGKTLWYYSPFVEQVTIYNQADAIEQTPFVLLTRNQASDWDNYLVAQTDDRFTLTPTAIDSNQGKFQIEITKEGLITGFHVIEQDGQESQFMFSNVNFRKSIPKNLFTFNIPQGVEVDDQR